MGFQLHKLVFVVQLLKNADNKHREILSGDVYYHDTLKDKTLYKTLGDKIEKNKDGKKSEKMIGDMKKYIKTVNFQFDLDTNMVFKKHITDLVSQAVKMKIDSEKKK